MGSAVTQHYAGKDDLLVLGLLKGSFIFLADLVRHIHLPLQVDFLVASSYGMAKTSSGDVDVLYDPDISLEGKHVLLVEDIVDSGNTLNHLVPLFQDQSVVSLEMCVLLHKHLADDLVLDPRWIGFDAPDEFLVGYGLDYAEGLRHLPFIGII
jgi:hypoxanthine phosphoribosyltransferase